MDYSIKQLRQKTKEIIDIAESGQSVTITYRGRKKAKVVPLEKKREKTRIGFGMWSDRGNITDSSEYVRGIRMSRQ